MVVAYQSGKFKQEISKVFTELEVTQILGDRLSYENLYLSSGFYYPNEKLLVISDSDFYIKKKKDLLLLLIV